MMAQETEQATGVNRIRPCSFFLEYNACRLIISISGLKVESLALEQDRETGTVAQPRFPRFVTHTELP